MKKYMGMKFHQKLRDLLQELKNRPAIIMGDFNYRDIDWLATTQRQGASREQQWIPELPDDCFYIQHVRDNTREDAILDLVLSTDQEAYRRPYRVVENLDSSDHNMITGPTGFVQLVRQRNRPDEGTMPRELWCHKTRSVGDKLGGIVYRRRDHVVGCL